MLLMQTKVCRLRGGEEGGHRPPDPGRARGCGAPEAVPGPQAEDHLGPLVELRQPLHERQQHADAGRRG